MCSVLQLLLESGTIIDNSNHEVACHRYANLSICTFNRAKSSFPIHSFFTRSILFLLLGTRNYLFNFTTDNPANCIQPPFTGNFFALTQSVRSTFLTKDLLTAYSNAASYLSTKIRIGLLNVIPNVHLIHLTSHEHQARQVTGFLDSHKPSFAFEFALINVSKNKLAIGRGRI